MAIASPNTTANTTSAPSTGQGYGAPLATVTTLFFMWGFLACLNDILVPHLKAIFDLNYTRVMLIQFAFRKTADRNFFMDGSPSNTGQGHGRR